jgi:hypothetical protein
MEIWDGTKWVIIRQWLDELTCETPEDEGQCFINWYDEAYTESSWFDINGGSDGLRMRNIHVRYQDIWSLFSSNNFNGGWIELLPYQICRIFNWYHFTYFRGTPSC